MRPALLAISLCGVAAPLHAAAVDLEPSPRANAAAAAAGHPASPGQNSAAKPVERRAAPARSGYADVNGLRMYYEVHGASRDGVPPLVVLHGGGSTIQTSFGTLLPLLARTRKVIAFEQQGHGHTADVPDRPFSFAQSASDAAALLRFLGVERADLIGYSNGGHIAIQLALDHPELVHRLVVVSAMTSRDGADPQFWEGFPKATLDEMPRELKEAYLAAAPHPEDLPTFFSKSVKRMQEFQGWSPEQLKAIRAPTLLLLGDRDVVRPEHAVWMYRTLPDARLAILPGTDHMAIVRRADVVYPLVEGFLSGGKVAGRR
jgi:pimeloyl-ACP methyl ester carboxylesterase